MARVLVVDDEAGIRSLLVRVLDEDGHDTDVAADVPSARLLLERESWELVLCDVNLPGESGIELVREALACHADLAVVMVTGEDDPALAGSALELGAYGYLVKPFRTTELSIAVANALRRRRLEIENRSHRDELEHIVQLRTEELRSAIAELERKESELQASREEAIRRLARAAESRDLETGQHIERVSRYAALLAEALGLPADRCELLRLASPLHDVGKIAIADAILRKPGPLSPGERLQMEQHAVLGHEMLAGSGQPLLELAALIALTHHERWDGLGYPHGIRGERIPLEGRIVAVADVFDALTSDRVYRGRVPAQDALTLMRAGRGTQFDPAVLDLLPGCLDAFLAVQRELRDEAPPIALAAG